MPASRHSPRNGRRTCEGRNSTQSTPPSVGAYRADAHRRDRNWGAMGEIARWRYTWDQIGKSYFALLKA